MTFNTEKDGKTKVTQQSQEIPVDDIEYIQSSWIVLTGGFGLFFSNDCEGDINYTEEDMMNELAGFDDDDDLLEGKNNLSDNENKGQAKPKNKINSKFNINNVFSKSLLLQPLSAMFSHVVISLFFSFLLFLVF